jgi:nucleotide-binding universal stress UspA family protein
MKKFLVATDLSERSDRAVQRGLALAHERGAEVELLHIIDDSLPEKMLERHEETARSTILDQIASLPLGKEVKTSATVIRGQAYADILRRAEEVGPDLIILGIPRRATRELFRGTTVERVIRFGHTPVLVVRDPVVKSYRDVLVGIDLSVHSRRALEFAAELVPRGEFHLVHATHAPFTGFLGRDTINELVRDEQKRFGLMVEQDITELTKRLGPDAPRCEFIAKEGMILSVMREQAAQLKPDLIAIGTHGRTGIANVILGSVAEDLLADAPVDVLAVKAS